jgi:hypothetical protein
VIRERRFCGIVDLEIRPENAFHCRYHSTENLHFAPTAEKESSRTTNLWHRQITSRDY